jgi:hypothetical protein
MATTLMARGLRKTLLEIILKIVEYVIRRPTMSLEVAARTDLGELHVLSIKMDTRTMSALLSVDRRFDTVINK